MNNRYNLKIAMKKLLIILLSALGLMAAGCSTDYEILKSVESIILTADSSVRTTGETINFTVTNNNGDVLTNEAAITVNGTPITGNTFTSDVVGTFQVKASYLGIESQPVEVRFHDGSETNFIKRVLIEDYTGTWCGYCPRVAYGIELAKQQSDNVVAVAIHRPSSVQTSSVYDPYNFDASELEAVLDAEGYPKGFLNRMTQWDFPEPDNIAQVIALTQGQNPKLGLAMSSTVSGGNISIEVSTKFATDFSNLKLVVYVLENGLIYDQHNYTEYYNGEDILVDYEHNHVLRATLTPLLGEAINNTETVTGNTFTRTFNVPVPGNVANAANIEFVAFIIDENGKTLNVRQAEPGETQGFEEI
jgi:thiol-disulfide isomerase/thioredoxin